MSSRNNIHTSPTRYSVYTSPESCRGMIKLELSWGDLGVSGIQQWNKTENVL